MLPKGPQKESFSNIKMNLIQGLSEMDVRGTDEIVTKAICVVMAFFEAAERGHLISGKTAYRRGLTLARASQEV